MDRAETLHAEIAEAIYDNTALAWVDAVHAAKAALESAAFRARLDAADRLAEAARPAHGVLLAGPKRSAEQSMAEDLGRALTEYEEARDG